MACGLRDLFAPGTPLPFPGDDKLMLVLLSGSNQSLPTLSPRLTARSLRSRIEQMFGSAKTKKDGLVAAPVEGVFLFLEQFVGVLLITIALAKLSTIFTHTQESTFLRRNLLLVFGLTDLLAAYYGYLHSAFMMDTYGADIRPYIGIFAVEGLSYVHDALLRKRKVKRV